MNIHGWVGLWNLSLILSLSLQFLFGIFLCKYILPVTLLCLPQLFICQYHIWLAADTKGILVLIPGNPSLNIMVSTFIFVCVAHEISLITNDLAQVIIPKDSVALLKRLGAVGLFSLVVWLLTKDSRPTPGAWTTVLTGRAQQSCQTPLEVELRYRPWQQEAQCLRLLVASQDEHSSVEWLHGAHQSEVSPLAMFVQSLNSAMKVTHWRQPSWTETRPKYLHYMDSPGEWRRSEFHSKLEDKQKMFSFQHFILAVCSFQLCFYVANCTDRKIILSH